MNNQEKRKAFEKLLAGAPEVMSPLQVSKWTPYGRNTVYAMLRSGEFPSIPVYILSKAKTERRLAFRLALAQREGFEPSWDCSQTDFESAPL